MSFSLQVGKSFPLGAHHDGEGINFAVFSAHAERIDISFFDRSGNVELYRGPLPARSGDVFHGYLPAATVDLVYAFHAHGPWDPAAGHRFDSRKRLLDPYAREIVGTVDWRSGIDRYDIDAGELKARVTADQYDWRDDYPPRHAADVTLLYELHVKGYSQRNTAIPAAIRGSYAALGHPQSIRHLRALGVTAVSLLPVQQHLDEKRLVERSLVNYWGYNTLGFFCPSPRLASLAARTAADAGRAIRNEFRDMVRVLHAEGIEVILDIVFNHTCESDEHGPTLSWRGLDNSSWYRLDPINPAQYVNDTGCGNTLDAAHPRVRQFIIDVLRYWVLDMHVDGFRFDLATTLGRDARGFDAAAPLFNAIAADPVLAGVKHIAEPWDIGPGGYQLGSFPDDWLEWNDRFRDCVRRYWVVGDVDRGEFARRLCGSSDIFERRGRKPAASVNYVTAHDGFTLRDLVSYRQRRNHANAEDNCDGHGENFSNDFGTEGDTSDPLVRTKRARVERALLATVLLAQGTPMIAAGSELGHSQQGNNNPYCQDNELTWLDWSSVDKDLLAFCTHVAEVRQRVRPLAANWYAAGREGGLQWCTTAGAPLQNDAWHDRDQRAFQLIINEDLLMLFNPAADRQMFKLPAGEWRVLIDSAQPAPLAVPQRVLTDHELEPTSLQLLKRESHRSGALP